MSKIVGIMLHIRTYSYPTKEASPYREALEFEARPEGVQARRPGAGKIRS